MRRNLNHIAAVILIFVGAVGYAQDPEFTQFYANPIYLNPAFTGAEMCPKVHINHRNQWPNISGNYVTSSFSYDQKAPSLSGGLGLMVVTDNAAKTLKTNRISGTYAFIKDLGPALSINVGFEGTFFQRSVDWNKLVFGDMIDPKRGFVYQTQDIKQNTVVSGVDFSSGAILYSDYFYLGFAAHHLTEPNESMLKNKDAILPTKYTLHAGTKIELPTSPGHHGLGRGPDAGDYVSPNILIRRQGTFQQVNLGLYVKKGPLTGGIWYRNKDAFIILFGINAGTLRIGYSYDVTISALSLATGGAHEISITTRIPCKPKKKKYRTLSCPAF